LNIVDSTLFEYIGPDDFFQTKQRNGLVRIGVLIGVRKKRSRLYYFLWWFYFFTINRI